MNYTLHKLPQGFIITSDEIRREEANLIPHYQSFDSKFYKVIAQQDQIDFSALSEEEQKRIDWFDAKKLALNVFPHTNEGDLEDTIDAAKRSIWINGSQKALEFLSDGRFTMEDIYNAYGMGHSHGYKISSIKQPLEEGFNAEEYIEICVENSAELHKFTSNLKNKSWKVELEMEWITEGDEEHDEGGTLFGRVEIYSQLKMTNGKFKITKIL